MKSGPSIASVASLMGDPARANMLTALMSGKALTASELAREAGVTAQTASGHLAKLLQGGLVSCVQQGRHRYFRLAASEIADVLEDLLGLAARASMPKSRTGPREAGLRRARVCYDHLAGETGVRIADGLIARGGLLLQGSAFVLSPTGRQFFCDFGVDMDTLETLRRPLCRACLDWSERRPHLGGSAGAALFARFQDIGWVRRIPASRAVQLTPTGELGLRRLIPECDWTTAQL